MANSEGPVLLSGEKTVATAGTAEALLGTSQRVKSVATVFSREKPGRYRRRWGSCC